VCPGLIYTLNNAILAVFIKVDKNYIVPFPANKLAAFPLNNALFSFSVRNALDSVAAIFAP
jgi:hypothetical protein